VVSLKTNDRTNDGGHRIVARARTRLDSTRRTKPLIDQLKINPIEGVDFPIQSKSKSVRLI
jgi:hypothetical protein